MKTGVSQQLWDMSANKIRATESIGMKLTFSERKFYNLSQNVHFDTSKSSVPLPPSLPIFLTADVRQPWTNYVNKGNEYLIMGVIACSEDPNI